MARTSSAKKQAIDTAIHLFRSQGYAATGLSQLLEESGAPKGSFYFHFPGGKEQLALEALSAYGSKVSGRMRDCRDTYAGDPEGFIRAVFAASSADLVRSDFTAGCVATNLGCELGRDDPAIANAVRKIFNEWGAIVADGVSTAIPDPQQAKRFGLSMIGAINGSRSLGCVFRSTDPLATTCELYIAQLQALHSTCD